MSSAGESSLRIRTLDELRGSPDERWFARAIERVPEQFDAGAPVYVARAPGRLDVMGGIADYSGSLVLQLPLEHATTAMLQPTREAVIDVTSLRASEPARFRMPIAALLDGELRDPARLAAWLADRPGDRWASYVIGVAHACLMRAGIDAEHAEGFRLVIESRVPEGKGVSSSAALEVSCLAVIAARYGVAMSGEAIATMAQWAENHVAGAPCGIMDQMTSACGRQDRLLRLRCQPGTVEGHVAIPSGYRFYGIDSGIRHAVTGADYGSVRTAAFMGYRIIADIAGLAVSTEGSRVRVDDPVWGGYLANMVADFDARFLRRLPERMTGAEFLSQYGGTTDTVTRVHPERTYHVRQATTHPVREHARVSNFGTMLEALHEARPDAADAIAREMGALMQGSHESYGACGLGSTGTDRLVELVREAGAQRGLFGAKITGGGSGGTVAVLGRESAEPVVREIAARYERETGLSAEVFARSGPGAEEMGVLRFTLNG